MSKKAKNNALVRTKLVAKILKVVAKSKETKKLKT
jgi:hypothetical protein